MPLGAYNLDFLAHNATRAYPLATESTRTDLTGDFSLPDDFIVGLVMPTHWGESVKTGKFFIRRISSYASGYWVTVGYDSDSGPIDAASALIPRAAHTFGNYYVLTGTGIFADSTGFLQIGELANIDLQPSGQFEFDLSGGQLEPDAIHPFIRGVMSLQAQNGSEISDIVVGRIVLQAGRNFRLRTSLVAGHDPIIFFDAIDGQGTVEDCLCTENQANPIRTISMVGPDGSGNLTLLGDSCFQFTAGDNALILEDKCSQPCCGCKELEAVTSKLEAFGSQATTLQNFLVRLEQEVTTFNNVVLGSRLGDRGCTPAA